MVQPRLIDQILKDLRLDEGKVRTKETPALTSKTLARHASSDNHDGHFDHRSIVGKLNFQTHI